uniref:Rapid ALkalinization Factor n=1 Tax=Quercus lobata TaxID=97700 RepID=A0A7N2MBF9_QUELO
MVEVRTKRGILLLMFIMVFLLKTISSSAAAAALYNKSNNNDTACCLIADDLESEFLMDSEVRRMLGNQISPGTQVKEKPPVNCGRGKNYIPCVPGKNGVQRPGEHCDVPYNTRNRVCRPQP